ncbi:hypothetical protein HJ590_15060 [Naumannella sp. ID2617S]|nr:hypothetical protein [Naumannella sp. ID2617S]
MASTVNDELLVATEGPDEQLTLYQGPADFPDGWRAVAHTSTWCTLYIVTGINRLTVDDLDQYARTGRLVATAAPFTDLDSARR